MEGHHAGKRLRERRRVDAARQCCSPAHPAQVPRQPRMHKGMPLVPAEAASHRRCSPGRHLSRPLLSKQHNTPSKSYQAASDAQKECVWHLRQPLIGNARQEGVCLVPAPCCRCHGARGPCAGWWQGERLSVRAVCPLDTENCTRITPQPRHRQLLLVLGKCSSGGKSGGRRWRICTRKTG